MMKTLFELNKIDGQEYPNDDLMRLVEKIMGVTVKECTDDVETGAAAWEHATEILGHIKAAREEGREQAAKHIDRKVADYVEEFGAYDPSTGQTEFSDAGEQYLETLEELAEEIRNLPTNAPKPDKQAENKVQHYLWHMDNEAKQALRDVYLISCGLEPEFEPERLLGFRAPKGERE
jgi:hypothetical protein